MSHKKIIVMVSGGVDSMVLLDLLVRHKVDDFSDIDIKTGVVVAHVNHGIRPDSDLDEVLVRQKAAAYGVAFESTSLQLGPRASEAIARDKRYEWIEGLRDKYRADIVMTAHHEDDVIETVILQILRGTLYRGLVPFEREGYVRPLLNWKKQQILEYAHANRIGWREDTTNESIHYLRNYVRHQLLPRLETERETFVRLYKTSKNRKQNIEAQASDLLVRCLENPEALRRTSFVWLPYAVRKELIVQWLRHRGLSEFDTKLIERATLAVSVAKPHSRVDLRDGFVLDIKKHDIEIKKVATRLV